MEVSLSDIRTLIRYLDDAAAFYRSHATTIRESDRPRLLRQASQKLKRKIK